MKKALITAGLSFACAAAIAILSGCFSTATTQQKDQATTMGTIQRDLTIDPTNKIIANALNPHLLASVALCIIGAFAWAFKGRAAGLSFMMSGILLTTVSVNFIQFPVSALATYIIIAAMAITFFVIWIKERNLVKKTAALEVVVEKVQNTEGGKEVKAGIKEEGMETASLVRSVVDPIKRKLEGDGVIKSHIS